MSLIHKVGALVLLGKFFDGVSMIPPLPSETVGMYFSPRISFKEMVVPKTSSSKSSHPFSKGSFIMEKIASIPEISLGQESAPI